MMISGMMGWGLVASMKDFGVVQGCQAEQNVSRRKRREGWRQWQWIELA